MDEQEELKSKWGLESNNFDVNELASEYPGLFTRANSVNTQNYSYNPRYVLESDRKAKEQREQEEFEKNLELLHQLTLNSVSSSNNSPLKMQSIDVPKKKKKKNTAQKKTKPKPAIKSELRPKGPPPKPLPPHAPTKTAPKIPIYKETETQTKPSQNKKIQSLQKKFPQPDPPLHPSYRIMFDYRPKLEERSQQIPNGPKKIFYQKGDVELVYRDGTSKLKHEGIAITSFNNGDILQEFPDGTTAYKYGSSQIIELRLTDGSSLIQFPNGQREKRDPDGNVKVSFGNGQSVKSNQNPGREIRDYRPYSKFWIG